MKNGIFELHELGKPVESVEIPDTPKFIESYRLLLHEINNGNIRLGFINIFTLNLRKLCNYVNLRKLRKFVLLM